MRSLWRIGAWSCWYSRHFTAVKPLRLASAACCATSSLVPVGSTNIARTESRALPPNSCQTGASKYLPLISQSAWSIALIPPPIAPPRIDLARYIMFQWCSVRSGSAPSRYGSNDLTTFSDAPGQPKNVDSPTPLMPVSVVNLTIIQLTAMNVSN